MTRQREFSQTKTSYNFTKDKRSGTDINNGMDS